MTCTKFLDTVWEVLLIFLDFSNVTAYLQFCALENSRAEESSQRINLKEMLEKERERCKMIENERDDLQMLFENALKANEELSAHQAGEPSSLNSQDQEVTTKFSFSEILESTENFNPSSKIEEGDYGSTYKGFLHHTQVIMKMMCSDSSQGPSQYHQEVRYS